MKSCAFAARAAAMTCSSLNLPEPPYALLVGHEIAYYASPRGQ